jgi:sugar lactone lactonase YvrE
MPMATGLTHPYGITLDQAAIYFTTNTSGGAVLRQPFSGNPVPIVTGLASPAGIAVDSQYVFWANYGDGTVMRATRDDGGSPYPLSNSETLPWQLAVDANDVYFTTETAVRKVPRSGGGAINLAADQVNVWGVAVDASGVYWSNHNEDKIMMRATGTTVPVAIATAPAVLHPARIALDATAIYWTDNVNQGTIHRLAK